MITFKQFILKESTEIGSVAEIERLPHPLYVFVGGTMGAGKSTFVNQYLSKMKTHDPDVFAKQLAGDKYQDNSVMRAVSSQALRMKSAAVEQSKSEFESFIEMGTGANTHSMMEKVKDAHARGYTTVFIFISTSPEEALRRNRARIAGGDRGVAPEKEFRITQAYNDAVLTFETLKKFHYLDYWMEVKN